MTGEVWRLRRGDVVLGEITIDGGDFPALHGKFVPNPEFAEYRPVFDALSTAAEEIDESADAVDELHERLNDELTLVSPEGPVEDFMLFIEGDRAGFRWI